MAEFPSLNFDTLTAAKERKVTAELVEFISNTDANAGRFLSHLLENTKEDKSTKKDVNDKLAAVNSEILLVLQKIEQNQIDEQDTSIKPVLNGRVPEKDETARVVPEIADMAVETLEQSGFQLDDLEQPDKEERKKPKRRGRRKNKLSKLPSIFNTKKPKIGTPPNKPNIVKGNNVAKAQPSAAKVAGSAVPDAPKSPVKATSIAKQGAKTASKAVSIAAKGVKGIPAIGTAVSMAAAAYEYSEAENDAERIDAVASNAGSAIGGAAGAVIGQVLIPIPGVGALIGGVIGGFLGGVAGEYIGEFMKDPTDAIPDSVTELGKEAEIMYIDNHMIPEINASKIDDTEKKEQIAKLEEYKKELREEIIEENREKLLNKLEAQGVISINWSSKDTVLDWNKLGELPLKDIEELTAHTGWSTETARKIEAIKSRKEAEQNTTNTDAVSIIKNLDDAIAKATKDVDNAVMAGLSEDAQAAKDELRTLQETRAKLLGQSTNTVSQPVQNSGIVNSAQNSGIVNSVQVNVPTVQSYAMPAQGYTGVSYNYSAESATKDGDSGFIGQVANGTSKRGEDRVVAAAEYATTQASKNSTSTSYCALYVANALEFGGKFAFARQPSAYMYNRTLAGLGFKAYPASEPANIGDIIVYGKSKMHEHGHIQIWNGKNWCSDWIQLRAVPYRAGYDPTQTITLWRFSEKEADATTDTSMDGIEDSAAVSTQTPSPTTVEGSAKTAEASGKAYSDQSIGESTTPKTQEVIAEVPTAENEGRIDQIESAIAEVNTMNTQTNQQLASVSNTINQKIDINQTDNAQDDNMNLMFPDEE